MEEDAIALQLMSYIILPLLGVDIMFFFVFFLESLRLLSLRLCGADEYYVRCGVIRYR